MRITLAALGLLSLASGALAQSTPQFSAGGSVFGRINSQWNTYFGAKADVNNGVLNNSILNGPTIIGAKFHSIPAPGVVNVMDYVSGSAQQTTGSISSGQTQLTLANTLDFQKDQGILVVGAGATFAGAAPTSITVTPQGSAGSTTYNYALSACDGSGGFGANVAAQTTTGNARLTVNNYNTISWSTQSTCVLIWKSVGSDAYSFWGSAYGTTINDQGQLPEARPFWAPDTPPTLPQADWLVTKITGGAGTTNLVLSASASNSVSDQIVLHDDTVGFTAFLNAVINSTTGAVGSLPAAAQIRLSSALPQINASGKKFVGGGGTTLLPAGAADGTTRAVLFFNGGSLGAGGGLLNTTVEGSNAFYIDSTAGYEVGGYILVTQQPKSNNPGLYTFISPITSIDQANKIIYTSLAAPVTFNGSAEWMSWSGAVTAGDVSSFTVSGCATATISYTATAADAMSGNNTSEAAGLLTAAQADAGLASAGFVFERRGRTIIANYPRSPACTFGSSSSGTSALTVASAFQATTNPWTPQTDVVVSGLTIDMTGVVNSGSLGYLGVLAENNARLTVQGLRARNIVSGSGIEVYQGFDVVLDDIECIACGDPSINDIYVANVTNAQLTRWRSLNGNAFGPVITASSYIQASDIIADNAQRARCFKVQSLLQSTLSGLKVGNCGTVGVGVASASYKVTFHGLAVIGQHGVTTNAENIWFSSSNGGPSSGDDDNNYIKIFGLSSTNSIQYDIVTGSADTDNEFHGITVGLNAAGNPNILNAGNAAFFGLNGQALCTGQDGPSQEPTCYWNVPATNGVHSTVELDKTNDTYADIAGLHMNMVPGFYNCSAALPVSSGAVGGLKMRLNGTNGLTVSQQQMQTQAWNGTTLANSAQTTSFSADLVDAAAVFTNVYLSWSMTVSASGTMTLQGAQEVTDTTAAKFLVGSRMGCTRTP